MFAKMTNDGLEETQDRLGGFQPLPTDIYNAVIKMAYASASEGGAQAVNFLFSLPGGREYRETIYITNKKGENFFLNKDDKTKKVPLPGFVTVDDICLCATEKPLAEQDVEDKVVNVYDTTAKKELPKKMPVLVDLLGQPISLGIVLELQNKTQKDGAGKYVAIADEVQRNTIEKVFHTESKFTMVEVRNQKDTPEFWDAWLERNKDKVKDKREIKGGQAGTSGAPTPAQAGGAAPAASPRKSLFGKK